MIRFSQLNALIDTEKNHIVTESPIECFLKAPCKLLGKVPASEYNVKHCDWLFVHSFNPSELKEGTAIQHTDLEWISHSKPTQDLSCKSWSAIAFDRSQNEIVSGKSWSVWASDSGIKERWLKSLQNKYSNIPVIS